MDHARALALRWGAVSVVVTGVLTYGAGGALGHDVGATTVSFVTFAALFGGTAAFLGHEVAAFRRCPRCGHQQTARPGTCPDCGYDVKERPRFVCPEAHVALEPGVCHCGRRRQPYVPPDVGGRVTRMLWAGAALLVALVVTRLLLGG